jgi:hypothetical protein
LFSLSDSTARVRVLSPQLSVRSDSYMTEAPMELLIKIFGLAMLFYEQEQASYKGRRTPVHGVPDQLPVLRTYLQTQDWLYDRKRNHSLLSHATRRRKALGLPSRFDLPRSSPRIPHLIAIELKQQNMAERERPSLAKFQCSPNLRRRCGRNSSSKE